MGEIRTGGRKVEEKAKTRKQEGRRGRKGRRDKAGANQRRKQENGR